MRNVRIVFCVVFAMLLAQSSRGAAQLASGAKTSAAPTSTNPQIRQMQISFDPDVAPLDVAAHPDVGNYAVTSFQLSVQYDPSAVAVKQVNFLAPYQLTAGTQPQNNAAAGIVSTINGQAPLAAVAATAGQHVDIFTIDFTLNNGISFNTPLSFTIFGAVNSDFITGTDPSDNSQLTSTNTQQNPTAIEPTTINMTYQQMIDATTPEPASLALLGLSIPLLVRRRKVI